MADPKDRKRSSSESKTPQMQDASRNNKSAQHQQQQPRDDKGRSAEKTSSTSKPNQQR